MGPNAAPEGGFEKDPEVKMALAIHIPEGACCRSLSELEAKSEPWVQRHLRAWLAPDGVERSIRDLIIALARYGNEHRMAHSQLVGEDGYLGPVFKDMARSLCDLLNGDIRRFDGGTLDHLIREIARDNGVELE